MRRKCFNCDKVKKVKYQKDDTYFCSDTCLDAFLNAKSFNDVRCEECGRLITNTIPCGYVKHTSVFAWYQSRLYCSRECMLKNNGYEEVKDET